MARFFDKVGYGLNEQSSPGVWEDVIIEREHFGDVLRNTRKLDSGEKVNDDISVGNSISIVADAYAMEHFANIKYVVWLGVPWVVSEVEVQPPRLIFRLGDVYNGPTARAPEDPE